MTNYRNSKHGSRQTGSQKDCNILATAPHQEYFPKKNRAKHSNAGNAFNKVATPVVTTPIAMDPAIATPVVVDPTPITPVATAPVDSTPVDSIPSAPAAIAPDSAIQAPMQLSIPAPSLTPEVKAITDKGTSWIGVDTDTDGLGAIEGSQGIKFDIANTGTPTTVGWISANDALLSVDLNNNGSIDNGSELFGGGVGQGFAKLSTYDSNRDGIIDAKDTDFAKLKLWNDANSNALTDPGELQTFASAGLPSINLNTSNNFGIAGNNLVFGESSTTMTAAGPIDVTQVYFA
jgi:hypothetical protein